MAVFKQGPRPEEDFTMISNALARNPEITIEAKGIYMFMRSHRDGWNMTVARIAKALGVSKDRASKYINELIAAGYIVRRQEPGESGRFGEIEYLILTSPRPDFPDTVNPDTENPDPENQPTKEDDPFKKTTPKEDQYPQTPTGGGKDLAVIDDNTPKPRKRGKRRDYTPDFEAWWRLYPRRIQKATAFESWLRATHGPDAIDPDTLNQHTARFAQYAALRIEPRFIPYPATWLNGARWEDELDLDTTRDTFTRNQLDNLTAGNGHQPQGQLPW